MARTIAAVANETTDNGGSMTGSIAAPRAVLWDMDGTLVDSATTG